MKRIEHELRKFYEQHYHPAIAAVMAYEMTHHGWWVQWQAERAAERVTSPGDVPAN